MIVVKSKITDKFLKQYSGSSSKFRLKTYYQVVEDETLNLPEDNGMYYKNKDGDLGPRALVVFDEMHKSMFNAGIDGARQYTSISSALRCLGVKKNAIPDYIELYEVSGDNLSITD